MTRVPVASPSPGWSPLHYAANGGQDDVVTLLLQAGADPSAKDNEGETPLHVDANSGRAAVVQLPAAGWCRPKGQEQRCGDST